MNDKKSVRELQMTEVSRPLSLTNARYSLARDEGRLLFMVMSQMEPNTTKSKYEIKVSDYSAIFGVSSHEASRDVRAAINSWFQEKYVTFHLSEESTINELSTRKMKWIITNTNLPKKGSYEVELHPDLLPYLNDLKENINYPLKYIIALKNNYQYRFYDLFAQYQEVGELELSVDWIRERMELEDMPAYARSGNIKSRIIKPAVTQINKSTPLTVEFEDITEKRKIVGWKFTIKVENQTATEHPNDFTLTATNYPK